MHPLVLVGLGLGVGEGLGLGVGLGLGNQVAISTRGCIIWQGCRSRHNTGQQSWMCAHLMRLWLGMGYRAAWRFREVSRDAKGLGTSSKLHCYVGLRIVTLSKNLIKYENRYSEIFNIGYRELHATYMDFFFFFFFNDPPQPAPQIKWQFLDPPQPAPRVTRGLWNDPRITTLDNYIKLRNAY